jgi:hypothetical protein
LRLDQVPLAPIVEQRQAKSSTTKIGRGDAQRDLGAQTSVQREMEVVISGPVISDQ